MNKTRGLTLSQSSNVSNFIIRYYKNKLNCYFVYNKLRQHFWCSKFLIHSIRVLGMKCTNYELLGLCLTCKIYKDEIKWIGNKIITHHIKSTGIKSKPSYKYWQFCFIINTWLIPYRRPLMKYLCFILWRILYNDFDL